MTDNPDLEAPRTVAAEPRQIRVRLVGFEQVIPQFATTFSMAKIDPDEWVLTIATIAPPAAMTDLDLAEAQFAPAFVGGRFMLTPKRASQLIDLLMKVYNDDAGREVYRRVES